MLRDSVSGDLVQPLRGLNLRDPAHTLHSNEVIKLQNLYWDGFIRVIPGVILLTDAVIVSSYRIRGGTRFYPITGSPIRFAAVSSTIVSLDDLGIPVVVGTITSQDTDVYFTTWSITNSVYAVDTISTLFAWDATSFMTVTGTNIPIPLAPVVPLLDRLFAITVNGIERTDSLVDDVWSENSSWATFRPERPGKFVVLHPYTLKGTDTVYPGMLALQQSAYYHITGTNFGSDVTSGTASDGEDSSITIIDSQVGTSSPRSIVTVPGIGTMWFTTDKNVYWLPEGQLSGKFIGDKLFSNGNTQGLELVNSAALDKVWMEYFDRKLILGVPMGSSTIVNVQFWLDLRTLLSATEEPSPAWYGPMNVDTWSCVWREDQQGELRLMAGEGKASIGGWVYNTYQKDTAIHYQGNTVIYPMAIFQDKHNSFTYGQQSKSIQDFRLTAYASGGSLRAGVLELGTDTTLLQAVETYNE